VRGLWLPALILAMGFAAAHFSWRWFTRYFQGRVDDPQNADSAAIMLLWGCGVIALAAMGLCYWLLELLGWT
jgi:hypothetical protein